MCSLTGTSTQFTSPPPGFFAVFLFQSGSTWDQLDHHMRIEKFNCPDNWHMMPIIFTKIVFFFLQKHDEDYVEPDWNKNTVGKKPGETGGKNDFAFNPQAGGGLLGAGEQNPDIKAHHLLVLLLRLRQVSWQTSLCLTFLPNFICTRLT